MTFMMMELISAIQQFNIKFDQELLVSEVKSGASLTGDYVLKYTKDVTDAIKRKTKQQIVTIQTTYLELLKQKQVKQEQKIESEISSLSKYLQAIEGISLLKEKQIEFKIRWMKSLQDKFDRECYQDKANQLGNENTVEAKVMTSCFKSGEEKVEKPVRERKAHALLQESRMS